MVEARDLKVAELDMLNQETDFSFRSTSGMIEQQREVKDPDEIDKCAKAAEITDKTWNELISVLRSTEYTQYSELDLVDMIRKISSDLGGEGFSFDPIVATGAGSAEPHYRTSSKKLQKDTPLLIDLGIKCEGYCGDLTRTVYLGKAPEKFRNIYEKVLKCNMVCLEKCRAGVDTAQLTEVSKSCFREDGLEEYFLHGLGHGVGLEIHEEPFMRVKTEHKLKENSVVTIEPGLYFEGEFGIRIEDYVVVTQDGCKVLSGGSEKGLIEI
jgi:Xaa-Pro aminopeptidase